VVTSQCLLIGVLSDALHEFLRTLNQYTLEDICVPKQSELRSLLQIELVTAE
jgi:DNA-binding IscR family transcriptional regulator